MSLDEFESPRLLIQRGNEHAEDLRRVIQTFFNAKPFSPKIDIDPQTGEPIFKVALTGKIPANVRTIIKDIASNFRDALNHAVYAATISINGGQPNYTGFPFAKDANGVKGELNGKRLRDNAVEIKAFLESLNPHKAGNALLWALNSIRNPNTHRFLLPVMTASHEINFSSIGGRITNLRMGYSRWDATKNEVEFMRAGRGTTIQPNISLSLAVTFGDVEFLSDKEVFGALREIGAEAAAVVNGIEAETERIISNRFC